MSRTKVDWRSSSKDNYKYFCKKHPEIKITYDDFKNIIYRYNDYYRNYVLETGELVKLPHGFGDFTVIKKKRKRKTTNEDGETFINLPIDWQKTREMGKKIYNFNFHTEGYFFGWKWFKDSSRIKFSKLWYFKPSRTTSRLINHYLKTDDKYQHFYREVIK